ncbi:hypothetical protein [Actinocorallia aurea]
MDDPEGWRAERMAAGGEDREPPPWLRRARALAGSRGLRAAGAAMALAVVAGLAFKAFDAPKTADGERAEPIARLGVGVGKLWLGDEWFASDLVVPDLDAIPMRSNPLSDALLVLSDAAVGPRTASVFSVHSLEVPIRVEGVAVDRLECRAPSAGTFVSAGAWGGSAGTGESVVSLAVDVDAPEPAATVLGGAGGPFPGFAMKPRDLQRFEVVFTSARHCTFTARLVVSAGAVRSSFELSSATHPEAAGPIGFEVTGPAARYAQAYAATWDGGSGGIERLDPREFTVVDGRLTYPPG